jgi:hypothetical protein
MAKNPTEEFILEHSKLNETGDIRTMVQESYFKYQEEFHQLPPQVLKSVAEGERTYAAGATGVAARDLASQIAVAKKNGDDPSDLVSSVRVSRPSGQLSVEVRAERTTTNPKTAEKLVQHGVVIIKARTKGMISPDAAEEARKMISGLLG